jgi:hypothetical protein
MGANTNKRKSFTVIFDVCVHEELRKEKKKQILKIASSKNSTFFKECGEMQAN